jgi:phosphopantetheinyl transferase
LEKTFRGKPFLPENPLFFNLSHTKNAFLMAFCIRNEVGVDLEFTEPNEDFISLSNYAFSPDEQVILSGNPCAETFLKIWTMKEAYLKATGIGMVDALTSMHVVSAPDFGVTDERYGSLIIQCPGGETGSVVCAGLIPDCCMLYISSPDIQRTDSVL